jgi:hypothetical protein
VKQASNPRRRPGRPCRYRTERRGGTDGGNHAGQGAEGQNRLAGRLAKVQADIQAYNSVLKGQAGQVNVLALLRTREELVGALVGLKAAINEANREVQRDIYDLTEKKATAQFLAGVNTRHGPQPPVYASTTEVNYVAALKKADMDGLVVRLESEIDQLRDRLD